MAAASSPRMAEVMVQEGAERVKTPQTTKKESGPALTEEELLMASGAYRQDKYNEYQRQVGSNEKVGVISPWGLPSSSA